MSVRFCADYTRWINLPNNNRCKVRAGHPALTFTRQETEWPNSGGKDDKPLLGGSSPGPLFIIQCENFLDESQGCFALAPSRLRMPVFFFHQQGAKVEFPLPRRGPVWRGRASFLLMKSQTVPMIFPLQGCFRKCNIRVERRKYRCT